MTDSDTITLWLGIMAVALTVQTVLLVAGAVFAVALYRRSARTLEDFQRREVQPLLSSLRDSLDAVEVVLTRVQRIDDDVRRAVMRAGAVAGHAATAVRVKTLPAVAIGRATAAAWSVLRRRFARTDESRWRSTADPALDTRGDTRSTA